MAEKARRGEFFNLLPPGYLVDRDGTVVRNVKLEEVEQLKAEMQRLSGESEELSEEEEQELLSLGRRFPDVWNSEAATPAMKKRIIRTVIEEIVANLDDETEMLTFTIHWKGGTHTQFGMAKPASGTGHKTAMEDLEIIRKMGARYGDDEIARVLNKLGRTTGKGNRWNEQRVATVRRRYQIAGHRRKPANPELVRTEQPAGWSGNSSRVRSALQSAGMTTRTFPVALPAADPRRLYRSNTAAQEGPAST